jgi:Big-like domain-containing protein
MNLMRSWEKILISFGLALPCCTRAEEVTGEPGGAMPERPAGELAIALAAGSADNGVTAVRIDLVAPDEGCTSAPLSSRVIPVPDASSSSAPDAATAVGEPLRGSFLLPPGDVRVCVTPLAGDVPSERCLAGEQLAHVAAGQTTTVSITLQCRAEDGGSLVTEVSLNDAPRIEALTLDPAATLRACETLTLTLNATDADGDPIAYAWTVGDPRRLRPYEGSIEADGATATFSANLPGSYTINIALDDGRGGSTDLTVPVEVTAGTCD